MQTFDAEVIPSPSSTTEIGRKILAEKPNTTGSLGCAISEAVEKAVTSDSCRYVLGSVLNQVLSRSGRDEQATMTTLAGLVVVLMMVVQQISGLFELVKNLFGL